MINIKDITIDACSNIYYKNKFLFAINKEQIQDYKVCGMSNEFIIQHIINLINFKINQIRKDKLIKIIND